ncbi:MAG: M23 family metallopeptidase [Desulfobacterium sp.]|nr:M23 family metallopeptidase [Desulfobacterium sp.]
MKHLLRIKFTTMTLLALLWLTGMANPALAGMEDSPTAFLAAPVQVGLGQPFLVRLTSEHPLDKVRVRWMGKKIDTSISSWNKHYISLAMLGTDVLTAKTGPHELLVSAGVGGHARRFKQMIQVNHRTYPRQDLNLPENMVSPPKEVQNRLRAERKLTTKAKNTISSQRTWQLPFYRPVPGKITSLYGLRRYLNKKPKNPHRGLDFRSPLGSPVKAAAQGQVILVGNHYYAGNSIYIDHGNGVVSLYFHLQKPLVETGDRVTRGQTIGMSGTSGRSTGPHLHFSVSVSGALVDPEPLFEKTADHFLE